MSILRKNKKEIIDLTKQTLEGSSIHAIPNIIRNKFYLVKIVWLACFLVSFGFCCWFMVRSINDYLTFSVTSQFEIKYENQLKFPIITICSLNFVKSNILNQKIRENFGYYPSFSLINMAKVKSRELFYSNSLDGFYLNETVMNCRYNNMECNFINDFEDQFYDFNYGQCFKFNSGKNMLGQMVEQKYIFQNGVLNGLILDLYIGSADENNNVFSMSQGMNIFINDKNHFDSTYSEGINISPGTTTKISIDKVSLKKEQKPYSECTANLNKVDSYKSDIYRRSFFSNISYSYIDCKFVCLQKMFDEECKCQIANMFIYSNRNRFCLDNLTIETINNDFDCLNKVYTTFSKSSEYIEKCDCPIECEKTYYMTKNSIAEFPTLTYSQYLKNFSLIQLKYPNITYEKIKKSVARIEIFYDELKQITISEKIKTEMSDLIANLGGTLGLFLGIIKQLILYVQE
jgi:hypothetical protein